MALYNDGAMKEVGYVEDENNYIYDIDPKVREDWKNGLCDLGIMREEPQIKVPKKLLQELIAVRDPEKPISEKLQKLIRQMMVVKKALSRK